jgi:hypothetical protein
MGMDIVTADIVTGTNTVTRKIAMTVMADTTDTMMIEPKLLSAVKGSSG